jgi:hypothetical protein
MRPVIIPKGSISPHTFPLYKQNDAYRTCCDDYHVSVFIKPPESLAGYYERTCGHNKEDRKVYTPCVIEKMVHMELSHHKASLLVPPDIKKESRFFQNGMIIPLVELDEVIGPLGHPKGYIMTSEYLGSQRLFASSNGKVSANDVYNRNKFQALIIDPKKDDFRNPFVILLQDSHNHEIVNQNYEAIGKMELLGNAFWWDV